MISGSTFQLLGKFVRENSEFPQRDLKLMAKNLKMLLKMNRRILTKIELSRLLTMRIGTREIESLAKRMKKKDGNKLKKRNVKDVVTIIKYRLKDALLEEKKARKIYLQDRENLWKTIQPKTSQQILLMKKYTSLKKETAEKEFEQGKKKLMKN